jgi:Zn finger protein HypA/HybF involved in hydrogenase expression
MAFSEAIKKEVRQKAAYQCCRCKSFGVEVHHIIPQESGGSDMIDNAAPLCPNCHADFGDNIKKRKIITEMRDFWYETIQKIYGSGQNGLGLLKEIDEKIGSIQKNQSDISELKKLLKNFAEKSIDNLTLDTITANTGKVVSATTLGDKVHANVICSKCGTRIGLLVGSNVCPNCKTPIN